MDMRTIGIPQILSAALLALGATNASAFVSYAGQGNPLIGASVIATGGEVFATFVEGSGAYDNYLYVSSPFGPYTNASADSIGGNWIFENHLSVAGTIIDLGYFAAGTELIFNVLSDSHGGDTSQQPTGYLNWYTGSGGRNADGFAHAFVDSAYTGPYGGVMVGFEDLANLGDAGYEDIRYTFTNVTGRIAEPGSLAMFGLGLAALAGSLRRKTA